MNSGPTRRIDLTTGIATVLAITGTVSGRRVSQKVEDVSFVALVILLILFVAMAWWRLPFLWRNETARWRAWVSIAGCLALSLAFGLPLIPFLGSFIFGMGFGPRWDYKLLMFGFGVAAVVLALPSPKRVRWPLIALVGLILPVGV